MPFAGSSVPLRRIQHADRQMLAIASCTSSALTLNGLVAARPAVAAQTGLPAIVSGVSTAYAALSRPVQVGIPVVGVAALAYVANEGRKREALLSSGEECMMGDDGKCEECAPRTPKRSTQRRRDGDTRSPPRQARLGAAMISGLPRASSCTSVRSHPRQTTRASRRDQPNDSPSPNPIPTTAQMTRRSTRRRSGSCSWPRRPRGWCRPTASRTS